MRRFLRRVADGGGQAAVIDPGTLSPAIWLDGRAGISQSGGNLTSWVDRVGPYSFTPNLASAGVTVFSGSSWGLLPDVTTISICGGNFYRSIHNNGLPAFSAANGYTQLMLTQAPNASKQGQWQFLWPSGANGLRLIYQPGGFDGGPSGGVFWSSGTVVPGNIAVQDGSTGYDTGIVTPTGQSEWDLWGLVSDGSTATLLYRNGLFVRSLPTGAVSLATELVFGGPSAGSTFVCSIMAAYLLYTSQLTAGQMAATAAWFQSNYGAGL